MKKKVLLVDDDSVTHFINRRLLEGTELTTHIAEANNGKEALTYINRSFEMNKEVPDVIFLDIDMPVMNGFMFIEKLRALIHLPQEKIKIVLLSSSHHEKDHAQAKALGINCYLNKPLSTQLIFQVLNS